MKSNNKMILDLCGGTGAWSLPYKNAGYDVRNITLPDYDVRSYDPPHNVYGVLAAPPCTQFSKARTRAKIPRDIEKGIETVEACLKVIWKCQSKIKSQNQQKPPLKFWALENPDGMLVWFLGKPAYQFHPYQFGHRWKKATCLWGIFNTPMRLCLYPNEPIRSLNHDKRWTNLPKEKAREFRGTTPSGFAKAFFEANR